MKHSITLISFITVLIVLWFLYIKYSHNIIIRIVGKKGENIAKRIIEEALTKDDVLLTNIVVKYEDRICECDDIIINKYGVFVVEVKNYGKGLSGGVNDKKWKKIIINKNGEKSVVMVKNPFKQVNRNCDILSKLLSDNGLGSFIKGYVMAPGNKQLVGKQLLKTSEDVDREIHNPNCINKKNYLSRNKQEKIYMLIKKANKINKHKARCLINKNMYNH